MIIFLNTKVSGMSVTTNSNGDKLSPWNIPLWMSTSPRTCPPAVSSAGAPAAHNLL